MAIEHELASCTACGNRGMVAGARCEACNGQGFVRIAPAPVEAEEATVPPLESLRKADLVAIAESRGLDTSGTKADLIERIEAAPEEAEEAPAPVEAEEATP